MSKVFCKFFVNVIFSAVAISCNKYWIRVTLNFFVGKLEILFELRHWYKQDSLAIRAKHSSKTTNEFLQSFKELSISSLQSLVLLIVPLVQKKTKQT